MIERVRGHRPDDGNVIDNCRQIWQQAGQLCARLSMPRERKFRPKESRIGIDKCGAIALQQFSGRQLSVESREFRLVVEQLQMARRAGHEQEDHAFRFGGEMGHPWRQRIDE